MLDVTCEVGLNVINRFLSNPKPTLYFCPYYLEIMNGLSKSNSDSNSEISSGGYLPAAFSALININILFLKSYS